MSMKDTSKHLVGQPIFKQILDLIPRNKFNLLVSEHKSDRYYKTFDSWTHLMTMLFGLLSRCDSMGEICDGMQSMAGKLNHLGLSAVPAKSTAGDGLRGRDDLDEEIEDYYEKPIERIQDEYLTMNGFKKKASIVLDRLFSKNVDSVISGTPSGLKFSYLQVYKRHKDKDLISICLNDSFENVLDRLTFFNKDSNLITVSLDEIERKRYFKEIRADYNFFKDSYKRADFQINIEDVSLDNIPELILKTIGMNK